MRFFPPQAEENSRVLLLGGLEEAQESRMLAEQILDLRHAGMRPVLDPRLRQVILDVMKAALVHEENDRSEKGGRQWAGRLIYRTRAAY